MGITVYSLYWVMQDLYIINPIKPQKTHKAKGLEGLITQRRGAPVAQLAKSAVAPTWKHCQEYG